VSLLAAQYGVKKADLNVSKPGLAEINQKQNILQQDEANGRWYNRESTTRCANRCWILSFRYTWRTGPGQSIANRHRAPEDVKTLAPMSGMVAIKQNKAGNFNFGMQMPDIRQGDELQAGMNVRTFWIFRDEFDG